MNKTMVFLGILETIHCNLRDVAQIIERVVVKESEYGSANLGSLF